MRAVAGTGTTVGAGVTKAPTGANAGPTGAATAVAGPKNDPGPNIVVEPGTTTAPCCMKIVTPLLGVTNGGPTINPGCVLENPPTKWVGETNVEMIGGVIAGITPKGPTGELTNGCTGDWMKGMPAVTNPARCAYAAGAPRVITMIAIDGRRPLNRMRPPCVFVGLDDPDTILAHFLSTGGKDALMCYDVTSTLGGILAYP